MWLVQDKLKDVITIMACNSRYYDIIELLTKLQWISRSTCRYRKDNSQSLFHEAAIVWGNWKWIGSRARLARTTVAYDFMFPGQELRHKRERTCEPSCYSQVINGARSPIQPTSRVKTIHLYFNRLPGRQTCVLHCCSIIFSWLFIYSILDK